MINRMVLLVGIISFYSVSLSGTSYINFGEYQYDVRLYNSDTLIVMGGGQIVSLREDIVALKFNIHQRR
jgi:hypothetical protein